MLTNFESTMKFGHSVTLCSRLAFFVIAVLFTGVPAKCADVKIAIVPGGDPKPVELLVLTEAKLFEQKEIALVERTEIDKVLAEQKLSGMFDAAHAVQLGQILKADIFAVLETTSVVIFDAKTGLRFVDETLPEQHEEAIKAAVEAIKTAIEKRQKLAVGTLVTYRLDSESKQLVLLPTSVLDVRALLIGQVAIVDLDNEKITHYFSMATAF